MICPLCSKSYAKWKAFREHLVDPKRKHKPEYYDRCGICGDLFETDNDWKTHTAARRCQPPQGGLKDLTHLTRRQADDIKRIQNRGLKTDKSNEQLAREVWSIVRLDEPFPAYEEAWRINFLPALRSRKFQEMASDLPEVQHLSKEDRVKTVIQICSKVDMWLTRCASDLVGTGRGQVPAAEHPRPNVLQLSTSSSSRAQDHQSSELKASYPAGINDLSEISISSSYFQSGQGEPSQAVSSSPTSWLQPSPLGWSEDAPAGPHNEGFDSQYVNLRMLENGDYTQLPRSLGLEGQQPGNTTYGESTRLQYTVSGGYTNYANTSGDLEGPKYTFCEPNSSGDLPFEGRFPKQD